MDPRTKPTRQTNKTFCHNWIKFNSRLKSAFAVCVSSEAFSSTAPQPARRQTNVQFGIRWINLPSFLQWIPQVHCSIETRCARWFHYEMRRGGRRNLFFSNFNTRQSPRNLFKFCIQCTNFLFVWLRDVRGKFATLPAFPKSPFAWLEIVIRLL